MQEVFLEPEKKIPYLANGKLLQPQFTHLNVLLCVDVSM